MTTVPPTLSSQVITNTAWSTNFWLSTTASDGIPTQVPVVHCGCVCSNDCDKNDNGDDLGIFIILWGVPLLPNVQFSGPKLPGFHFPACINLLFIDTCLPVSDNGSDGHHDPDDPNDNNKPSSKPLSPSALTSPQSSSLTSSKELGFPISL